MPRMIYQSTRNLMLISKMYNFICLSWVLLEKNPEKRKKCIRIRAQKDSFSGFFREVLKINIFCIFIWIKPINFIAPTSWYDYNRCQTLFPKAWKVICLVLSSSDRSHCGESKLCLLIQGHLGQERLIQSRWIIPWWFGSICFRS